MRPWGLLDEPEPAEGAWNMAVDEALLASAEKHDAGPVLRLYAWRPWCLSLGYHQDLDEACDAAYCRRAGYDVVRRPTGGKAVLHADEVTYAVVGRLDDPHFAGLSLVETYGLIADALAASFRLLGLDVEVTRRPLKVPPKGGAPCFLVPSEKELLVEGRKVVGSAQRRGRAAFLQHGAIPLHMDYGELARAAGQSPLHAQRYREAFAGLADVRPGVTAPDLRLALRRGFRQIFDGPWVERPLEPDVRQAAHRLRTTRYATSDWTEGRHAPSEDERPARSR